MGLMVPDEGRDRRDGERLLDSFLDLLRFEALIFCLCLSRLDTIHIKMIIMHYSRLHAVIKNISPKQGSTDTRDFFLVKGHNERG